MPRTEVHMPKFGMTMTEGTIADWTKTVGETVTEGEILVSVETEKVLSDIVAPCDGTLVACLFDSGAEVPVGQIIAIIES